MTPTLIGLGGRLRSGKDTVAEYLATEYGFTVMGMSDALLEHALIVDPWIPFAASPSGEGTLYGSFVQFSTLVKKVGYVAAKEYPEVRRFLQADGTPGGREFHHENVWVDRIAKRIAEEMTAGRSVVLTGLRFPNEVEMAVALGGLTAWVDRPQRAGVAGSTHVSETSVDSSTFARVIDNSGSLEDLYRTVDALAEELHLTPIAKDPTAA